VKRPTIQVSVVREAGGKEMGRRTIQNLRTDLHPKSLSVCIMKVDPLGEYQNETGAPEDDQESVYTGDNSLC
jgi:hypothetical protein